MSISPYGDFACTMLLSRRVYPDSPNHRLGTLVQLLGLPRTGRAHRAMVDAEMTSHLWCRIQRDLAKAYSLPSVDHELLARIQRVSRAQLPTVLRACARAG